MPRSLKDLIREVRLQTQDSELPYRVEDSEMQMYLYDTFAAMYTHRPDIFPVSATPETVSLPDTSDLDTDFPLSEQWFTAAVMHMCSLCVLKDDEFGEQSAYLAFQSQFFRKMGLRMTEAM